MSESTITWRDVESSNVERVGWGRTGMFVKFRSGAIYLYRGVSRQRAVACAHESQTRLRKYQGGPVIDVNECLKYAGRPLGVLSIGGFPRNYTLRLGLTGRTLAKGEREQIVKALDIILSDTPDNYTPPTYDLPAA
jgi:hypothetical protein